jgi:AraC family transcriptional regulator
MIAALSFALMLGGAVSAQMPWNLQLERNLHAESAKTWALAGTAPKSYFISSIGGVGFQLRSNDAASGNDVETAYRSVPADMFSGKRISVSLEIRTEHVQGGAGLWVRVDDKSGNAIVLKDMEHNLIVGSRPWAKYELVVDIPKDGAQIGYGVVLVGRGLVSFQNVNIEALDNVDQWNR